MSIPNVIPLMNETITTAQTASAKTAITGLSKMISILLECKFTYGSGGTTGKAWVQTSLDGGTTWVDIANFAVTTASKSRIFNLTNIPVTTIYTPTSGTLADDTSINGILGDQVRVLFTSTGTYAGSSKILLTATPKF